MTVQFPERSDGAFDLVWFVRERAVCRTVIGLGVAPKRDQDLIDRGGQIRAGALFGLLSGDLGDDPRELGAALGRAVLAERDPLAGDTAAGEPG